MLPRVVMNARRIVDARDFLTIFARDGDLIRSNKTALSLLQLPLEHLRVFLIDKVKHGEMHHLFHRVAEHLTQCGVDLHRLTRWRYVPVPLIGLMNNLLILKQGVMHLLIDKIPGRSFVENVRDVVGNCVVADKPSLRVELGCA